MEFLRKIRDFVQDLDQKDFYKYLGITLGILILIISFMVYRYYSKVNYYTGEIDEINEIRSDQVKDILMRQETVQKHRKEANEMLGKDLDFKIKGKFDDILKKLNLKEYEKEVSNVMENNISDEYRENEITIKFDGMDMRQLCQLLRELDEVPRITIDILEIRKSKKKLNAIDVDLTISTLLLGSGETT